MPKLSKKRVRRKTIRKKKRVYRKTMKGGSSPKYTAQLIAAAHGEGAYGQLRQTQQKPKYYFILNKNTDFELTTGKFNPAYYVVHIENGQIFRYGKIVPNTGHFTLDINVLKQMKDANIQMPGIYQFQTGVVLGAKVFTMSGINGYLKKVTDIDFITEKEEQSVDFYFENPWNETSEIKHIFSYIVDSEQNRDIKIPIKTKTGEKWIARIIGRKK